MYVRIGKSSSVFFTPGTQPTITDALVPILSPTRRARATPICAVLLWLVVLVGACRSYFTIYLSAFTRYQIFFILFYFFTDKPRLAYLHHHHHLSPCCFFCVLLLFVIQQCHCSSCARHSTPTEEAGSILCACGRCALHSQYYSHVCCCHRHWPIYAHTCCRVCYRHFLLLKRPSYANGNAKFKSFFSRAFIAFKEQPKNSSYHHRFGKTREKCGFVCMFFFPTCCRRRKFIFLVANRQHGVRNHTSCDDRRSIST